MTHKPTTRSTLPKSFVRDGVAMEWQDGAWRYVVKPGRINNSDSPCARGAHVFEQGKCSGCLLPEPGQPLS